jgi:hypothetical protein
MWKLVERNPGHAPGYGAEGLSGRETLNRARLISLPRTTSRAGSGRLSLIGWAPATGATRLSASKERLVCVRYARFQVGACLAGAGSQGTAEYGSATPQTRESPGLWATDGVISRIMHPAAISMYLLKRFILAPPSESVKLYRKSKVEYQHVNPLASTTDISPRTADII